MQNLEWATEKRKLKDLIPADYNPRKLSKKAYEDLKKSLEKFNLADLPSINKDNIIISGHQRVKVLTDIYGKDHEIEVRVPNRLLNKEEEKELNIRANRNLGDWDFDLLANEFELEALVEWGFDEKDLPFLSAEGGEDEQGALDKMKDKKEVECPACGETFTP